jgi:hypothetical protein
MRRRKHKSSDLSSSLGEPVQILPVIFMDDVLNNFTLRALHDYRFKNRPVPGFTFKLMPIPTRAANFLENSNEGGQSLKNRRSIVAGSKARSFIRTQSLWNRGNRTHSPCQGAGHTCRLPRSSWDNVTTKGALLQIPDCFISWGPIMTDEIVNIYQFSKDRIYECDIPHFECWFRWKKLPYQKSARRILDYTNMAKLPAMGGVQRCEVFCRAREIHKHLSM